MSGRISSNLSKAVAMAGASRFARPLAYVALAGSGLVLLAVIGRVATAGGTLGASVLTNAPALSGKASPGPAPAAAPPKRDPEVQPPKPPAPGDSSVAQPEEAPGGSGRSPSASRRPATPDDPVILNTAGIEELRRLKGIGAKRAAAIVSLRQRLGRFRAIEDLLKVKGIGRATLKRLRPVVRLDPSAASHQGGAAAP